MNKIVLLFIALLFLAPGIVSSEEEGENASNPLAAVSNTDFKVKYYDLDNKSERLEYGIEGATMLDPKLKLKYELNYWDTDVTGNDEKDLESLHLKLLYFPIEGKFKGGQPYDLRLD